METVSLKDIAARAGVSFQTVSKVLHGKGNVSAETREWILQVAQELGYVPNALARSLVSQRTWTIGVVAGDFSDHVLSQFVVGAEREARRQGLCVIVGSIDQEGSDVERYLRILMERRIDGLLLAAPQIEHYAGIGEILRGQVPVVSIYHVPGVHHTIARVGSSHSQTGLIATQHLLEKGHRRIATITGLSDRRVTQSRLRGYQRALEEAGIVFDPDLVEEGNWLVQGGYDATMRLLQRAPDITAIFVQNDMMAIGVLSALRAKDLRVPDDCAVVGCDDIPIAEHTIPPLTTIHLPFYETGEAAVRLLLEIIAKQEPAQPPLLLPVYLVERASSGDLNPRPNSGQFANEKEHILGKDQN
jgi:LacI family transcriptional regulator